MNKKVIKEFLNTKDDKVKEDLKPVIMKWLDSEDLDQKTKEKLEAETKEVQEPQKEPAKEVKEEPKAEEVKPVEVKVEEQKVDKYQEQINKLLEGMEKLAEQNKTLTEKIEKSQSFGYSPQPSQPSAEEVDDIIAKAKTFK